MILVFLKAADDQEVAFANYHLLHGKFQELQTEVKHILQECVSKSNPVSLVIADSLYGLGKEPWAPRTEPDLGVAFKNVPHVQCPARLFEPRQAPQVL